MITGIHRNYPHIIKAKSSKQGNEEGGIHITNDGKTLERFQQVLSRNTAIQKTRRTDNLA